ncbi:adenosylcobinamide-GDP ribazoletransferase [Simiduia sp. 21SJ11W-1]|uniref:adenosylcobinamide-GDP ribazoletransferase n=1 Tax=Simiduia sp. 21SJ11W-1 TaxID=2909669 RepID=UPI0020A22A54|nr:adenosylcobinamide-GDP ribazoletransferase [Simiduia sp. 21SJ11W-1]UTA47681.1 adenosylcobinamide-GDP ribazoletransferase [Simiduia sp. 21SJ11W-1]
MITSFWLALMFLTRVPAPTLGEVSDAHQRGVLYFFPFIGLLIGALMAVALLLLPAAAMLNAALLVMFWVFVTGGLHIDGLGDSADGWLGGLGDKARTLEIMKDPRAGSAAVMTIACVLLVKFAALACLLAEAAVPLVVWALLFAPTLGRCVPALLFFTTPYARTDGLASPMVAGANGARQLVWVAVWLAMAVLSLVWLAGFTSLGLWVGLAVQLWLLRRLMCQRLGGVTGDTVGAAVEITEMSSLVLLAYLAVA